jgi:hypothetical protein
VEAFRHRFLFVSGCGLKSGGSTHVGRSGVKSRDRSTCCTYPVYIVTTGIERTYKAFNAHFDKPRETA